MVEAGKEGERGGFRESGARNTMMNVIALSGRQTLLLDFISCCCCCCCWLLLLLLNSRAFSVPEIRVNFEKNVERVIDLPLFD